MEYYKNATSLDCVLLINRVCPMGRPFCPTEYTHTLVCSVRHRQAYEIKGSLRNTDQRDTEYPLYWTSWNILKFRIFILKYCCWCWFTLYCILTKVIISSRTLASYIYIYPLHSHWRYSPRSGHFPTSSTCTPYWQSSFNSAYISHLWSSWWGKPMPSLLRREFLFLMSSIYWHHSCLFIVLRGLNCSEDWFYSLCWIQNSFGKPIFVDGLVIWTLNAKRVRRISQFVFIL